MPFCQYKSVVSIAWFGCLLGAMYAPVVNAEVTHVDAAACPAIGSGQPTDPFCTIQHAINLALPNDTIVVHPGIYIENIQLAGKRVLLKSSDPRNEAIVASTVIDGSNFALPTITISQGETRNTIVEGFTIRGGTGKVDDFLPAGGGIFCRNSSPTIRGNIIRDNEAGLGGGAYVRGGAPLFDRNQFIHNVATHSGGALKIVRSSTAEIRSNLFAGNGAYPPLFGGDGGAIDVFDCPEGAAPTIRNNTIVGSYALVGGSAISCSAASPSITNNIMAFNRIRPALWADASSTPTSCFNLFWQNIGGDHGGSFVPCAAGDQFADPALVDAGSWTDPVGTPGDFFDDVWAVGDYHLLPSSPCVNGGDPILPPQLEEQDLEGDSRLSLLRVDVGADELGVVHNVTRSSFHGSIQSAINSASNGDMIVIPPGTYYENIHIGGKNLVIRSDDPLDPQIVASTVINGSLPTYPGCAASRLPGAGTFTLSQNNQGTRESAEFHGSWGTSCNDGDSCDDGNECTNDYCLNSVCQHDPNFNSCDDQSECTREDYCLDGVCTGEVVSCDDNDPCTADYCLNDVCQHESGIALAFGSAMTFVGTEDESCRVEGLTITAGSGTNFDPDPEGATIRRGGGVLGNGATAQLNRCRIVGNIIPSFFPGTEVSFDICQGGGIYDLDGAITNCEISNNRVANLGQGDGAGGGLANCDGPISNSIIDNNIAGVHGFGSGGGLFNCQGEISGCMISRNIGTFLGGGLNRCHGTIRNCAIRLNESEEGGGIEGCNGEIIETAFEGNIAFYTGGAISSSSAKIDNCRFRKNVSWSVGGALWNITGPVSDSVFADNTAGFGRDIAVSPTVVDRCTLLIDGGSSGSGAIGHMGGQILISNSILFGSDVSPGNSPIEHLGGSVVISNSLILGDWLGEGDGNFDADPQFVDADGFDNIIGTADDDLRLLPNSPCINRGDPASAVPSGETDLAGNPRLVGCRVDLGAHESDVDQSIGDFNGDDRIDLQDAALFQLCFDAPTGSPAWATTCLCVFDQDAGGSVDLPDHASFQAAMTGP